MELRDYQRRAINETYQYWYDGKGEHPVVVAGTGAGKSVIQGFFIKEAIEQWQSTRILCVTHVQELIDQNHERLSQISPGIDTGIYSSGLKRRDTENQIIFAGIQSIYKKAFDFEPFDLVIIDECHLIPMKSMGMYRRLLNDLMTMRPQVKVVGLTATPFRMDNGSLVEGEERLFDGIACNISIRELVDKGHLTPLTAKEGINRLKTADLKTQNGEYKAQDQVDQFHRDDLITKALREVILLSGDRKKWMIFCANTAHSDEVAHILNSMGVPSASVHSKIGRTDRNELIDDFKNGKYKCLVSVSALTTGFDVPDVDLIVLFRSTKSAGLYLQICGRGMRLHPNKKDCLVLDFGENILNHGAVDEVVERELRRTKKKGKKGEPVLKRCGKCEFLVPPATRQCPECGNFFDISTLPKIQQEAARLAIMSSERGTNINEYEVQSISYRIHEKVGKPNSIRVRYYVDMVNSYSEWVCFNHKGFARNKAISWLRERMPTIFSQDWFDEKEMTTENVLLLIENNKEFMSEPKKVSVNELGEYPQITSFQF